MSKSVSTVSAILIYKTYPAGFYKDTVYQSRQPIREKKEDIYNAISQPAE